MAVVVLEVFFFYFTNGSYNVLFIIYQVFLDVQYTFSKDKTLFKFYSFVRHVASTSYVNLTFWRKNLRWYYAVKTTVLRNTCCHCVTYTCSAVGVVTGLQAGGSADRLLMFASSLERLNRLWGPQNLLFSWYRIVKRSWTSTPPIFLYGSHRYVFTFPLVLLACSRTMTVTVRHIDSCWRLVLHFSHLIQSSS
jgi:hypothetical protein